MSKIGGWESTGFGTRLKALREAAGLSQTDLAEKAGCHKITVSKLERNEQEPAWPLVLALCKALGVLSDAFLQTEASARDPAAAEKARTLGIPMTGRLIYHPLDRVTGGTSPFDETIMDMAKGQELQIASPYLGLSYLQRIITRGNGWRLLTDVQEWLALHAQVSRSQIADFILVNRERVHHCKDLHAKVLIAGTRALMGSANFTDKGITARTEMSGLFESPEHVAELRAWFDGLWNRTQPVDAAELRSCVATLPSPTPSSDAPLLSCAYSGVSTQLQDIASGQGMRIRSGQEPGAGAVPAVCLDWPRMARSVLQAAALLAPTYREDGIPADILKRESESVGGYKKGSIIPSDYCYNRINQAKYSFRYPILLWIEGDRYAYLGPGYKYDGAIRWKPREGAERVVGYWRDGKPTLDYDPRPQRTAKKQGTTMATNVQAETVLPSDIINSIGMKFVLIPQGKFLMGSPENEPGRGDGEGPQHEVELTRAFYLGMYEVTQEQYAQIMGTNPSFFSPTGEGHSDVVGLNTSRFPAEQVRWPDALDFCSRLTELPEEKRCGRASRLPTDAEWEYACRAGTSTPFHFGNALASTQANFNGNSPSGGAPIGPYLRRTVAVGSYAPNAWGLFDMHGNVWEWCSDWFDEGSSRVVRGGSWRSRGRSCRSAHRGRTLPSDRRNFQGFRVVMEQRS